MSRQEWLELCFKNWTTSPIQTEAWNYKDDFDGFCRWFLS